MNKKWLSIVLAAIVVIFAVWSLVVLPDPVIMQVGTDGLPTKTMPKFVAILVPVVLAAVGLLMNLFGRNAKNHRGTIVLVVCIAASILTLAFNS